MPAAKKGRTSPDTGNSAEGHSAAGHHAAGQDPWQGTSSEHTAQEGSAAQHGKSLEAAQYDNDLTYQQELDRLQEAGRKLSRCAPTTALHCGKAFSK